MHEKMNHYGICMWGWNDFHQAQVAWRIKKMRSAEMPVEIFTAAFSHQVDRNTGSIGRNQRTRLTVFFHFREDRLFYVEALHHYFDNPVLPGNVFHVVGKVAGPDS